jgi:hypothetical protein
MDQLVVNQAIIVEHDHRLPRRLQQVVEQRRERLLEQIDPRSSKQPERRLAKSGSTDRSAAIT